MEYAATVWDPLTQANIDSMEAIQRRAARFVLRRYRNTSSISNMIDELRWHTIPTTVVSTSANPRLEQPTPEHCGGHSHIHFCVKDLQTGYIGFLWVFFRNADLPFKSDIIINLLIAVALTEEEEEEEEEEGEEGEEGEEEERCDSKKGMTEGIFKYALNFCCKTCGSANQRLFKI